MKKKVRVNNQKIKNLVSEKLKKDGTFVHESKIDKAIREYLQERKEGLDSDDMPKEKVFTEKAKKTFDDMASSLYDIVEDLMIIQTKEPDVLVESYPEEMYSETFIEQIVDQLELIIESLEYLRDVEPIEDEDEPKGRD